MKLVTFKDGQRVAVGVADAERVVSLRDLLGWDVGSNMREVIERFADEDIVHDVAAALRKPGGGRPLAKVQLLAPIRPARNVFCVGWNYAEHFEEGKKTRTTDALQQIPEHPALFTKNPDAIVGPDAPVWFPAPYSEELDWEVELAVIIGRQGRDIAAADALDHIFGYTIANDVSIRDIQRTWHGGQWFKGKNFDSHLPLGPWIVTADEIGDPQNLRLSTRVNGVTKQDSNTKRMVFKIPRIIAELSAGMTLHPGDVVITGTPEGVGMGRTPPEWLKPGDVMELEIEGIGVLRNTVQERSE